MKRSRNKCGEAILLICFAVFAAGVLGICVAKTRHTGTSLYPPAYYPYQGKIMIGTNQAVEPKW